MFQLILVVVAIALMSALVVATVQYAPWWTRSALETEKLVYQSMQRLEDAYDLAVRAADGTAPAPISANTDGGLSAHFLPYLKFTPAAPGGFVWKYGRHPEGAGRYSNMDYFCLTPVDQALMQEGVLRGVRKVRSLYSVDQTFLADECGATSNADNVSAPADLKLTLYVAYTPGVNAD